MLGRDVWWLCFKVWLGIWIWDEVLIIWLCCFWILVLRILCIRECCWFRFLLFNFICGVCIKLVVFLILRGVVLLIWLICWLSCVIELITFFFFFDFCRVILIIWFLGRELFLIIFWEYLFFVFDIL